MLLFKLNLVSIAFVVIKNNEHNLYSTEYHILSHKYLHTYSP